MTADAASPMPKRWRVMALAQRLWEQHGHPGVLCEPGTTGIGSCALRESAAHRKAESGGPDA